MNIARQFLLYCYTHTFPICDIMALLNLACDSRPIFSEFIRISSNFPDLFLKFPDFPLTLNFPDHWQPCRRTMTCPVEFPPIIHHTPLLILRYGFHHGTRICGGNSVGRVCGWANPHIPILSPTTSTTENGRNKF